jgi:hypothetical protein
VAHTPGSKSVQIWFLFGWDGSFGTVAGVTSAVKGLYDPVIRALHDQGYDQPQEHVSRFPKRSLRSSITLGEFVKGIDGAGVVIVDGHATDNGFLPIEVYRDTAAGRKAAHAAFSAYLHEGYSRQDLGGSVPTESAKKTTLAIGLTLFGVAHHLHVAKDALVFLAVCHGKPAAAGFVRAGARTAVYWSGRGSGPLHLQDMTNLLTRMDGTALPTPSLQENSRRVLSAARSDCHECSEQLSAEPSPAQATLAPAITDRLPDPKTGVSTKEPFQVRVTFDTAMAASTGPADSVITLKGCGNAPASSADQVHWQDDHTIVGKYTIDATGTLTITVHHDQAKSDGAEIELNGNGGGGRSNDGAVAPNGDDFVWKVPCDAPIVHIVFTGTGTIGENITTTFPDGTVLTDTDTEHVAWTAVWNLDLRTILPSRSITPGTETILQDTFDPAASSFNGTANDLTSCSGGNGQCAVQGGGTTAACSGSFTSDPTVSPFLFVLQPPDSSGTLQILAPALALAAVEPCAHALIQGIPIALGGPDKTDIGPFTATFPLNPSTWKPQTINVKLDPPYSSSTSTSTSSGGSTTVTFNDQWSGTVALSVPQSS